jgi:hypothetical protein
MTKDHEMKIRAPRGDDPWRDGLCDANSYLRQGKIGTRVVCLHDRHGPPDSWQR